MKDAVEHKTEPTLWPPVLAIGTVLAGYGLILLSEEEIFLGFGLLGIFVLGIVVFITREMISRQPSKIIHVESTDFSKHTWMWIFLASEVMFFSVLIGISASLRWQDNSFPVPADTLNVPLTAINTFILICSSFTMVKAVESIENGDQTNLRNFLLLTLGLGATFLGIQAYEYNQLYSDGFTLESGLFGATFYLQTGFHGAHVFVGITLLSFVLLKAIRGGYSASDHSGVIRIGMYWHFVDLVWIVLFTIVYLM
ncbi:MAG: cytochrome c oxidase subunit 3 [Candidatus Hodarchaeales archaeon]|jgi:heme/copper-type cytochrome/quinol oxidase subunit 3